MIEALSDERIEEVLLSLAAKVEPLTPEEVVILALIARVKELQDQ